tara:strand:+ start:2584 stop:6972 length:4389 start_codon:yes stop_codon:yes gene_type:complete
MSLNPFNPSKKKYAKVNFVDALENITPNIYLEEDYDISGMELDPLAEVINSHLNIANNIGSIIFISSLDDNLGVSPPPAVSGLNTFSGITPFFIKQNSNTTITPHTFESKVLIPLGTTFGDYNSSADFLNYFSATLNSSLQLNSPSRTIAGEGSATHRHLITHIPWLYFLNTSADGGLTFDPSNVVSSLIVEKLYRGEDVTLNDSLKGLTEYIFKNYNTCTAWQGMGIYPNKFVSGTGTYVSGTQQLDNWKTWIDILYSPSYFDKQDTTVRDAFDTFAAAGKLPEGLKKNETYAGPFYRLLRAFSFLSTDIYNETDQIETLYDLEHCPGELLPLIAELIGWKLFGADESKWRVQLRNAVNIYKRAGTKQSIQFALNAIFPRTEFDVSSSIYEMWESYIPHLIYYSLATDSSSFDSFDTWTKKIAGEMDVSGYSENNMDDNIRMAVDTIILHLVKKFPEFFWMAGKTFEELMEKPYYLGGEWMNKWYADRYKGKRGKDTLAFKFDYRDYPEGFPIPPWEELPYYVGTSITEEMIRVITDKLACFGVRKTFALEVGDYIRDNTVKQVSSLDNTIQEGNGWLIFTSGVQIPPNWSDVLGSISTRREEYLSLWSGKSSHFKVIFDASTFDFDSNTLDISSGNAFLQASRMADQFSPAHAIPISLLKTADTDYYVPSSVMLPIISMTPDDTFIDYGNSKVLKNGEVSGANFVSWRRGSEAGTPFQRKDVDSLADQNLATCSVISTNINRNSFRRRNYKYLLPQEGWYNRTGHNMPLAWHPSALENSYKSSYTSKGVSISQTSLGFSPLGFIPSAQTFVPIDDYHNLPNIYGYCENLTSSSTFSGIDTSNTFPCRGLSSLGSNEKFPEYPSAPACYVDRGDLPRIVGIMHSLLQRRQYIEALKLYETVYFNDFQRDYQTRWKNIPGSIANSALEVSSWAPSGMDFYHDFSFGRGAHKLYKDYTTLFNRHFLRPDLWHWDGPTIFGHTFNSILTNSGFYLKGAAGVLESGLFSSSIDSASAMCHDADSGPFSHDHGQKTYYLTDIVNNKSDLVVSSLSNSGTETRNKYILSGVDLVMTSGPGKVGENNCFSIYGLDGSYWIDGPDQAGSRVSSDPKCTDVQGFPIPCKDLYNPLIENPVIKATAVRGFPRIRIALKDFVHGSTLRTIVNRYVPEGTEDSNLFPIETNFLTPEHKYEFTVRALASDNEGNTLGGSQLGVWIHTDYEDGKFWNWMPDGKWVQHSAGDLTKDYVSKNLIHTFGFKSKDIKKNPGEGDPWKGDCIDIVDRKPHAVVTRFLDSHFEEFSVSFDTENSKMVLPREYHDQYNELHSTGRNYIFEFFQVANTLNYDKFIIFDEVKLQDLTNRERASIEITGDPGGHQLRKFINTSSIYFDEYEVAEIFKFWNLISGDRYMQPWASRNNNAAMEALFDTSGGSRLNYRTRPEWYQHTLGTNSKLLGFTEGVLIREGPS